MDLRTHHPFWLLRHGIVNSYPSLTNDLKTDVAIIGGGISGALVAYEVAKAGFSTVVVDRRHIATGSTAASTSLLQYEIDTPLYKLIKLVGERNAVRSYHLCRKAIYDLEALCHKISKESLFVSRPSFQFASFKKHVAKQKLEYDLRKKAGFAIQWIEENDIENKFGFRKASGLLSQDGAEANSYLITHRLLEACMPHGTSIYDNTEIIKITTNKKGIQLQTKEGFKIKAKKLVIACGYESQKYLPKKIQDLNSTYAIVSEPMSNKKFWFRNALIWETDTPYIYMRTTDDGRILVGGKDDPFSNPTLRDSQLTTKARALEKTFTGLFPSIPFKTDFRWAGTFGSTKDGLPYIGSISERPHTYFALGLGGNGITFSVIAAQIIRDLLKGRVNKDAEIFSFNR